MAEVTRRDLVLRFERFSRRKEREIKSHDPKVLDIREREREKSFAVYSLTYLSTYLRTPTYLSTYVPTYLSTYLREPSALSNFAWAKQNTKTRGYALGAFTQASLRGARVRCNKDREIEGRKASPYKGRQSADRKEYVTRCKRPLKNRYPPVAPLLLLDIYRNTV